MDVSRPTAPGSDRRWGRGRRVAALLPGWTVREVRAQYRQSTFDIGWSLLTPVITLAGFGVVLTAAFGVDGDGIPYITFAWAGLVMWTFVANALLRGASSLVSAADLVRKVAFPREVVPLSTVLSSGLDLLIGLVTLGVLMIIQGVRHSVSIVAAIPVLVVAIVWTAGAAILLATVTAFIRDLAHGLAVVLRIGIFVTPVMYPVSALPDDYLWLTRANPVAVFVEALRDTVLRQSWPQWDLLGAHGLAAAGMLLLALWYVRRVEGRMADVI